MSRKLTNPMKHRLACEWVDAFLKKHGFRTLYRSPNDRYFCAIRYGVTFFVRVKASFDRHNDNILYQGDAASALRESIIENDWTFFVLFDENHAVFEHYCAPSKMVIDTMDRGHEIWCKYSPRGDPASSTRRIVFKGTPDDPIPVHGVRERPEWAPFKGGMPECC